MKNSINIYYYKYNLRKIPKKVQAITNNNFLTVYRIPLSNYHWDFTDKNGMR